MCRYIMKISFLAFQMALILLDAAMTDSKCMS